MGVLQVFPDIPTMISSETATKYVEDILPLPVGLGAPRLKSLSRRLAYFLVPSFLSRNDAQVREVTRPTDFLDGLRGYAAFVVFIHHFFMPVYLQWQLGYGGGQPRNNGTDDHYVAQLPFIRLLFSGPPCVYLFFVVSGFSISLKPISLVRAGASPQFLDTMVSAIFRRTARLYVPCLAMLFISLVLTCGGAYDYVYARRADWPIAGARLVVPQSFNTMMGTIMDWIFKVFYWVDPLPRKTGPNFIPYSSQLWTIPVELRCSLVCFVAIIGLARVRPMVRIGCLTGIAVYWHLRTNLDAPLFLAGTILAELFLIRQEYAPKHAPQQESGKERLCNTAGFVISLFFLGFPRKRGDTAMFWGTLYRVATFLVGDSIDAPSNFFLTLGSVGVVYSVSRSPSLQHMFTSPLGRYLGKISFALYLVHMSMLVWFGYRTIPFWWSVIGTEVLWKYAAALGIAFLVQTVVTVWVADLFWRAVDAPSVTFARWIEGKCKIES